MDRIVEMAPSTGYVIAALGDRLIFAPYEIRGGVLHVEGWENPDLTDAEECCFFDESREYRRVRRSAHRDTVETVLTAQEEQTMDPDLLFTEVVLVKPRYAECANLPSRLTIINRYRYSRQDTLVLEDYRISPGPV